MVQRNRVGFGRYKYKVGFWEGRKMMIKKNRERGLSPFPIALESNMVIFENYFHKEMMIGTINRATMLMTLIMGLMAGPAVSL